MAMLADGRLKDPTDQIVILPHEGINFDRADTVIWLEE